MPIVYLGLGGNVGDTVSIFNQTWHHMRELEGVRHLKLSSLYRTSPVGNAMLNPFVNAVCSFYTPWTVKELFYHTQQIEKRLGKIPKPKTAPRPIDIDLLFYGELSYQDHELHIPHPAWHSRLFVLVPLAELTPEIQITNAEGNQRFILKHLIQTIHQSSDQEVSLLDKKLEVH